MNIDYHVHLEEGPYSANWIGRTANALEFFREDKSYSYKWMQSLLAFLNKRAKEGAYCEYWLDLYLERAKQLGIKEVGIVDHLYRFHDALDYYKKHIYLESDKLGNIQRKWLNQVSVIPFTKLLQGCYEKVASSLRKHNIASELNTGLSYRAPIKEACPSPHYLQTLAKYQIPMTLSSDAHYPDDLGTNLDLAKKQLKKYGYERLAVFSKRRRFYVPF
ncbi:MAG: hypothetical protein ACOX7H_04705 [Bacillota bacterium]|jgi:histidinol phosphatase-like PHP family hydrolase